MKLIIAILSIFVTNTLAFGQADSIAPYEQVKIIPPFSIRLADSTLFTKAQLKPKTPTIIIYFSPDCGYCQEETEELISKLTDLNNLQVVMVTSRPHEDMVEFVQFYKLDRFPAIKVGTDLYRFIANFYAVKFTPFSAVYNKKGNLLKAYKSGIDWKELKKLTVKS